jgi:hypothetical protein
MLLAAGKGWSEAQKRPDQRSPVEAPLILPVGSALAVMGLLSLGLWGSIWLAAYSLAWP